MDVLIFCRMGIEDLKCNRVCFAKDCLTPKGRTYSPPAFAGGVVLSGDDGEKAPLCKVSWQKSLIFD